jgi:hypothetical protein
MPLDRTEWISLTVALAGLLTALILIYLSLTTTAKPSANFGCLASHTLPKSDAPSVHRSASVRFQPPQPRAATARTSGDRIGQLPSGVTHPPIFLGVPFRLPGPHPLN